MNFSQRNHPLDNCAAKELRRRSRRATISLVCCLWLVGSTRAAETAPENVQKLPGFAQVQSVVSKHFASLKDRRPQDVVSQGDVGPIFGQLAKIGWKVADQDKIMKQLLGDGDFLVVELRSQRGRELMRKTSGHVMIYDRLDRIAQVYGGQQLIRDLQKLPDPEKYTKQKTARGNPDLLDLLPKQGSGKTRTIENYEKPTGRIYTADQFVSRLRESYAAAKKAAESGP